MTSSPVYVHVVSGTLSVEFARHRDTGKWWARVMVNSHPKRWELVSGNAVITPNGDDSVAVACQIGDSAIAGTAQRQAKTYARLPRPKGGATLRSKDIEQA